jgi:hypothetical protein
MCLAACDASLVQNVSLTDLGTGSCGGFYFTGGSKVLFDCAVENNLFGGQKCKTYRGEIFLSSNKSGAQSLDFQKWLTNVGLGDLVTAGTSHLHRIWLYPSLIQLRAKCCKTVVHFCFHLGFRGV